MTKNANGETLKGYWIASMSYPGKKEFFFGTIFTEPNATESMARIACRKLWESQFPYPMPEIITIAGGRIYVVPDNKGSFMG